MGLGVHPNGHFWLPKGLKASKEHVRPPSKVPRKLFMGAAISRAPKVAPGKEESLPLSLGTSGGLQDLTRVALAQESSSGQGSELTLCVEQKTM